nr:MAG TPA: hypothetical protein [Caudoviricetes sp.]
MLLTPRRLLILAIAGLFLMVLILSPLRLPLRVKPSLMSTRIMTAPVRFRSIRRLALCA